MKQSYLLLLFLFAFLLSCSSPGALRKNSNKAPFIWDNANIYFMLTDRFYNGDPGNDVNFGRSAKTAKLRGFMGGDLKGITKKIEEGYFNNLGITAIWFTPVVEQIHGIVDEGTGSTYGFHGYWAKDWTRLDPNFGTEKDLAKLVKKAHQHGIRIILDAVINHTGPVTGQDPVWPDSWVRTGPPCKYTSYESTVNCTLVKNLPDVKTESNMNVELPPFLLEKWKKEDRLEQELAELDAFFQRTGYPRAPRFYIIKWLTDYIRQFGIDGYRCDTAKHTEESVWAELQREAEKAFQDWKKNHPGKVLDKNAFYMVGEVYNYGASGGRIFNYGDKSVDFFDNGFHSLVNFEFKGDANNDYEAIFSKYSRLLNNALDGKSLVNYISSHDDGGPYDKERAKPIEAGTKLLLCPGATQVYYGDETSRSLIIEGTKGDATLRSFMNWSELADNYSRNGFSTQAVLSHWQKLGRFRRAHPAVGAGIHTRLSATPYVFKREYTSGKFKDQIVVGLGLPKGKKELTVAGVFADGSFVRDYYSGQLFPVKDGKVVVHSDFDVVLLEKKRI